MNIYLTVSEEIPTYDSDISYCIADLVNAKSISQALYLAWKNDDSFCSYDITEMPKFKIQCKRKNSGIEHACIVSDLYTHDDMWTFSDQKIPQ